MPWQRTEPCRCRFNRRSGRRASACASIDSGFRGWLTASRQRNLVSFRRTSVFSLSYGTDTEPGAGATGSYSQLSGSVPSLLLRVLYSVHLRSITHLERTFMQSDTQTAAVSKKALWAGRIISALPVLFLLMDGVMNLVKPALVVEATVKLGYP